MRRGTLKEGLTEKGRPLLNVVTAGSMGSMTPEKVSTLDTVKAGIVIV